MSISNPYHEGELIVQEKANETIQGRQNGRAVADSILQGAFNFIKQQTMIILGSEDARGNVWASVLFGYPGFIQAANPQTLELNLKQVFQHSQEPFWANIHGKDRVGILLIELASRRRLRINGIISQITSEKLCLSVLESYPNCPKYIQRRHFSVSFDEIPKQLSQNHSGTILTSQQQEWIKSADTFFVASNHPTRGLDASHRGGNPGFVQIINNRTLRIPDYRGNSMFNTLGNFVVNPHAGLIFIDFERSRTLQLIGQAKILWNLDNSVDPTGGTNRYWNFEVEGWLETSLPIKLHSEFLDYSPYNPI
ncbi:MAG: pyridoxamine 5'-phosphate oxidase family protein [Pleurocapsa sp.]